MREREITAAFREVLGPGTEASADLPGSLLTGVTSGRHAAPAHWQSSRERNSSAT